MTHWLKNIWRFVLLPMIQVALLAIVHLFGFILGAQLAGFSSQQENRSLAQTPIVKSEDSGSELKERDGGTGTNSDRNRKESEQARMFALVALICLLNSTVMVFWISRSTLSGLSLIAGSFAVFTMCFTVMPLSDAWFFSSRFNNMIRSGAVMGFCIGGLIAVSTVPIFGRWGKRRSSPNLLAGISRAGFFWRMALSVLIYVALYLLLGYFIAWQVPELRSLYGGSEDGLQGFWERMTTPPVPNRVIPFQMVRGIVWTFLCVAMIRFSSGSRWQTAVVIALVISVVMNSQLLLPNPVMSKTVRIAHMEETAVSNFLFAIACVGLFTIRKKPKPVV